MKVIFKNLPNDIQNQFRNKWVNYGRTGLFTVEVGSELMSEILNADVEFIDNRAGFADDEIKFINDRDYTFYLLKFHGKN